MTRISVPVPGPTTVITASANMTIGSELSASKTSTRHGVKPARPVARNQPEDQPGCPGDAGRTEGDRRARCARRR